MADFSTPEQALSHPATPQRSHAASPAHMLKANTSASSGQTILATMQQNVMPAVPSSIAAPTPNPPQAQLKPGILGWKEKFASIFGKGNSSASASTSAAFSTPAVSSPIPQAQSRALTPTHSYRHGGSRSDTRSNDTRTGAILVPSPSAANRSHHSAAPSNSNPELHFDPDLSAGMLFSIPATESQLEGYLHYLWKLLQTTSTKERSGRNQRRRILEELAKLMRGFQFSELKSVCDMLSTLLAPSDDRHLMEEHHSTFEFLLACLECQHSVGPHRLSFYQLLTARKQHLPARLLGLSLLTVNGRETAPFGAYLATTLADWISELEQLGGHLGGVVSPPPQAIANSVAAILQLPPNDHSPILAFLQCSQTDSLPVVHKALTAKLFLLVLRFVKYNITSIGESGLSELIARMCSKAAHESDIVIQGFVLPFLDTLIRAGVPLTMRPRLVYALCLCVNISSRDSWSCMRVLLEGREGMEILHQLLESMDEMADEYLSSSAHPSSALSPQSSTSPSHASLVPIRVLRGGVFLVAMASWASQRLTSLTYPFTGILLHFAHAVMSCEHILLVYEVALAVRRLIKKYGATLHSEWAPLLSILHRSLPQAKAHAKSNLGEVLAEIMANVEEGYTAGIIQITEEEFIGLLSAFKPLLHPSTNLRLLGHLAATVHPANAEWLTIAGDMVELFYYAEKDSHIQVQCLRALETIIYQHQYIFADSLIQSAIIGALLRGGRHGHESEASVAVRQSTLGLVAKLAGEIPTVHFASLVSVLEGSTACDVTTMDGSFQTIIIPEVKEIRLYACSLIIAVFTSTLGHASIEGLQTCVEVLLRLISHSDKEVRLEAVDALMRLRLTEEGRLQLEPSAQQTREASMQRIRIAELTRLQQQQQEQGPRSGATSPLSHPNSPPPLLEAVPVFSVFFLSPAQRALLSQTIFSALLRRLRIEPHRETFERLLLGLKDHVESFLLFDASPASTTALLQLAVDYGKHVVDDRRAATQGQRRRDPAFVSEVWSAHWTSPGILLDCLHCVRGIIGPACRATPVLVEELLSCILAGFEVFTSFPSDKGLSRAPLELLRQVQIYIQIVQVILLCNTAQLHLRYATHLLDRLIRLGVSPSCCGTNNDQVQWLLPVLQCAHLCATSFSYTHSTLPYAQQALSLALPSLSTAQAHPGAAFWASRVIAAWYVTLTLPERQGMLPMLQALINRQTQLPWNIPAACLLDFTTRHAYALVKAQDLHRTQLLLPSPQSIHSSLFPPASIVRSWISGQSLFTVRVGASDYVELIIRRPSGAASWIMRLSRMQSISTPPVYLPRTPFKALPGEEPPVAAENAKSVVVAQIAIPSGTTLARDTLHPPAESDSTPHGTPHSSSSNSAMPGSSVLSSYSSPARYIPPSSPGSSASGYHAWPRMGGQVKRENKVLHLKQQHLQQLRDEEKTNAILKDVVLVTTPPKPSTSSQLIVPAPVQVDAMTVASSLVEFALDASPTSSSASRSPPSPRTAASALLNVAPLLSYDQPNANAAESSPRLYALPHPGQRRKSSLHLSEKHSKSTSDMGRMNATAASADTSPSVTATLQPTPRRSTLPTGVSIQEMLGAAGSAIASSAADTGVSVSPYRSPPRSSPDLSPELRSNSHTDSLPSPSPSRGSSFSHHSSSPFRSAIKVIMPQPAGASTATTTTTTGLVSPSARQRLSSAGMSSPSSHRLSSIDRDRQALVASTTAADASPIQLPVPIRVRKPAPASSSLSLLTQAFSHQRAKSTLGSGDPLAVPTSALLASHELPLSLATSTVGGVSKEALEKMWTLIGQLEAEDERKSAEKKELANATATSHPAPVSSLSAEQWQPEYILAHLQQNFPDFSSSSDSALRGVPSWQSLSVLDDDSVSIALSVLDSTPIRDTLKIGVLYVAEGQQHETEILQNAGGSAMYQQFLAALGESITLQGERRYTGGMDREGNRDGEIAILFCDMHREIAYHVGTLLPARALHQTYGNKLRLLGNDAILIAFVEKGGVYGVHTLSSQTVLVHIVIQPIRADTFQVAILYKYPDHAASIFSLRLPVKQLIAVSALVSYVRDLCLGLDFSCQWWQQSRAAPSSSAASSSSTAPLDLLFGNQEQRCQQLATLRTRVRARATASATPASGINTKGASTTSTGSKAIPQAK